MKKILCIASFLLLIISACNDNKFQLNIEMSNANGKTVYLQRVIDGETINVDSVVVNNNKAVFNIQKNDNLDAYHIYVKGWRRALVFFADNQNVDLKGDYNSYNKITITTESETQKALDEFTKKFNEIDEQNDEDALQYFIFETVWDNPSNVLSPYILYRYKWAFELCELREVIANFSDDLNSGYLTLIKDYVKMLERTDIGKPYLDFTLKNINNEDVSLSELVGKNKVLMLDFWASWCPDCRVENPNIVSVYNDFHDKGFDIVSVSLDTDKDAWLKGIKDDGLVWKNHLSDLQGWNCSASQEYGVAFIPQNVLIDTNGVIIAKNLNGESLRLFIEDIFK